MLIIFLLAFSSLSFSQGRQDYALFFVVTDFENWTDFPNSSEQQVREIESELKSNYGFKTEFVLNPTRREIIQKLLYYKKRKFGENDQLLVYFSTHGIYKEGSTGALIPKDGNKTDPYRESWIYHPQLADFVNDIPCEHILLSIDACYSGTFGLKKGRPTAPAYKTNEDCKTKVDVALRHKSRLYVTSGGVERVPTDSEFADKWLSALRYKNIDGVLNTNGLLGVLEYANPQPRDGDFKAHKGGDFVFVNRNACSGAAFKTDAEDWEELTGNFEMERFLLHIRNYPNCSHTEEFPKYFSATEGKSPPEKEDRGFIIETAASMEIEKASKLIRALDAAGYSNTFVEYQQRYKVILEGYKTKEDATNVKNNIVASGILPASVVSPARTKYNKIPLIKTSAKKKPKADNGILVPNVLTPDGDGKNDYLTIEDRRNKLKSIKSFVVTTRWGEKIFEKGPQLINGKLNLWDGKMNGSIPELAQYYYQIEAEFKDGTIEILKGNVLLTY